MLNNILNIQSLSKGFTRRIKDKSGNNNNEQSWLIKDLNMQVPEAKTSALIGGNGTGKTTLFNIISGLIKPNSGTITYNSNGNVTNLLKKAPHKITQLGIGRMFQDNHIFTEMSVLDNMLIAADNYEGETPFVSIIKSKSVKKEEKLRIEKAENIFNNLFGNNNPFWEGRNMPAGNLSYGQQRLLGLTRLFMREYKLLLLDEPSAGVNPEIIEQIKKIIINFTKKKQTVLLIEHNIQVVQDIADYCFYLDKGNIKISGKPKKVIANQEVQKSYIG